MNNNDKIRQLICEISPVMPAMEEITEKKKLIEDFGFNSLEFIQLIVSIEETFEFQIEAEFLDLQILNDVREIFKYVNSKCKREKEIIR